MPRGVAHAALQALRPLASACPLPAPLPAVAGDAALLPPHRGRLRAVHHQGRAAALHLQARRLGRGRGGAARVSPLAQGAARHGAPRHGAPEQARAVEKLAPPPAAPAPPPACSAKSVKALEKAATGGKRKRRAPGEEKKPKRPPSGARRGWRLPAAGGCAGALGCRAACRPCRVAPRGRPSERPAAPVACLPQPASPVPSTAHLECSSGPGSIPSGAGPGLTRTPPVRPHAAYNVFVKSKLAEIKAARAAAGQDPLPHKEAFK